MGLVTYRVKGVSPLLQNSPAAMGSGNATMQAGKKVYDDKEESAVRVYRNDRGEVIVPSLWFRSAMMKSVGARKIGKYSARAVISAGVFTVEEECLLLDAKGKVFKTWDTHKVRVVVQKNGVMRCRPMFKGWQCDLALEVDDEMLPNVDVVTQSLNLAGKLAGIGDWRPGRGGTYGRFTAELKA